MHTERFPTPEWERISQIIKHYSFTSVSAFARHIGLNRGENLYQIKRGNNGISRELADRLVMNFPELSKAWILTGEGAMLPAVETNPILKQVIGVPFYQNFPFNRPPSEPDRLLYFSKELVGNADFTVLYTTDELYPLYRTNEILFLRKWDMKNPIIFGEVYFIITGYCSIFRIIRKSEDINEVCLASPNKVKYDNMNIQISDVQELFILK